MDALTLKQYEKLGPFEGAIGSIRTETQHQIVPDDPTRHVTTHHECEPAEHLALGHALLLLEDVAHAVGRFLVVGHPPRVRHCETNEKGATAEAPFSLAHQR